MASSKPLTSSTIRKGQIAMVCELCETEPKLKWKCLQCRRIMCERCRNTIHPKFPSAEDHTIIDIKDISKHEEEQKLDFTQLKCTEHAGQNCCLFCKKCDQLVCPACVIKTHKKHDLTEINEGFNIKVEKIKEGQKKIHDSLATLSKGENQIQKIQHHEESRYKKSKQMILNQESDLIEAVITHSKKHLNELHQEWQGVSYSIVNEQTKVKKSKEALEQRNEEVNDLLQSNDPKRIFNETLTSTVINIKPVNTRFNPVSKFVPGDVTKIPSLFGNLEPTPNLQVVQIIQTDLKTVFNVEVCPDNSLWINDINSRILQKVKLEQEILKILSNKNLLVKNIALAPSSGLLLCVEGSSVIKIIPSGTEKVMDSPYNVSPLQPGGIHVTQDNILIIGARDTGPAFPATGPRQVRILDQSGHLVKFFQYDHHNQALFTLPGRVTSTSNKNIGVIDWLTSDGEGRIVILNKEGDVLNTYIGHPDVNNTDNPFIPEDIKPTPSNNFIVADRKNHTLHILSSNGEIITYYNTEELGIAFPMSLSFNQTRQLYIGCNTHDGSDEKAKIYKLDNIVW